MQEYIHQIGPQVIKNIVKVILVNPVTFSSIDGASSCKNCLAGTFSLIGGSVCKQFLACSYLGTVATKCLICPSVTYYSKKLLLLKNVLQEKFLMKIQQNL